MKKTFQPFRGIFRRSLSLLLCCLLLAVCLGVPASSASGEPAAGGDVTASSPEDAVPDLPDDAGTPDDSDSPDDPDTPDDSSSPDDAGDQESSGPEESPEPDEDVVTVTFVFQEDNVLELKYQKGQTIPAEDLPDISLEESTPKGYVFEGWLDGTGALLDLAAPILEDMTYTAQWRPVEIGELLDTQHHNAYAHGYTNGFFKPDGKVTRAEASTLIFNLLLDQSVEEVRSFIDMKETAWCAEAVSKMYEMGVATGFDNGTFKPNRSITKAEFIKMAASLVPLDAGDCPFTDLKDGAWYTDYVISAYAKGWIAGDGSGKFQPDKTLTRAEAVTILNNILGRSPAKDIKSKNKVTNFYDVFPESWAYGQIVEATTTHVHRALPGGGEEWTSYTADATPIKTGWLKADGKTYYVGKDGKFLRGEQTLDGKSYLFAADGALSSGFFKKDGWTRYYKDGILQNDISRLGVVKGPYLIKVYKPANYLIIFAKDTDGKYTIPVRAMLASCGNPTPTGTFYTPGKYRWLEMVGGSWAQWCTQILDSYLFHSVPNDQRNNYTMWAGEYNNLGTTRSLGCIRLTCEDAKWVYDNCPLGTQVVISPTETSGPLGKPEGIKLPGWHTWDPTDPTAYWMCQQRGCH